MSLPIDLAIDSGVVDDDVDRSEDVATPFERFLQVVERRNVDSHEVDIVGAETTFQVDAKLFTGLQISEVNLIKIFVVEDDPLSNLDLLHLSNHQYRQELNIFKNMYREHIESRKQNWSHSPQWTLITVWLPLYHLLTGFACKTCDITYVQEQ